MPQISPALRRYIYKIAPLVFIIFFWLISFWNLDRSPIIHPDGPWILSPGYKLFTRGVYGSDMFAGFHGMESLYFEFMPLMSLLQGASVGMLGVGVMQMRTLPLILGTLTLALSFTVARKLTNRTIGIITMLLLTLWQWTSGNTRLLGSGIPLLDISRVARYDILVAPLGLAAMLVWIYARQRGRNSFYWWSGLLVGLAGMAHVYGMFWIVALAILHTLDELWFERRAWLHPVSLMFSSAAVIWLIWSVIALFNWEYFSGQTSQYNDRFNIFETAFYLQNIAQEVQRYNLGVRDITSFTRVGLWLIIGGIPLATMYASLTAAQSYSQKMVWLLVPSILFPFLFALLIRVKTFNYLIVAAPFFAILLAWFINKIFTSTKWYSRPIVASLISIVALQGAWSIGNMQSFANQHGQPTHVFFERLRQATPPTGRILGSPQYWLAMPDRDYRSIILPFFLSNPRLNQTPLEFEQAMIQIKPDIIYIDAHIADIYDNYGEHLRGERHTAMPSFLKKYNAKLTVKLRDNYGERFDIYELDWD